MAERAPSSPPDLAGYHYLRPLGVGGFADVFLYEQDMPRRKVAVKVLHEDAVDERFLRMFMSEANAMAQLSTHPSILTIYQASISADGRPYLVLEYCPDSVGERYRDEVMNVADVLYLGIRIASALATAHQKGILHRDIKPSNILVTEYSLPVLADFGIAGSTIDSSRAAAALSLPWSAPEVVSEEQSGDVASEVWSLGATLYALLAGRSPFERPGSGENASEKLRNRILAAEYKPIPRSDVPQELQSVLAKAMSKRPGQRYSSMEAFAGDLQRIQQRMRQPVTQLEAPHGLDGGTRKDPAAWQPPASADLTGGGRTVVELESSRPPRETSAAPKVSYHSPLSHADTSPSDSPSNSKKKQTLILTGAVIVTALVVFVLVKWLGL